MNYRDGFSLTVVRAASSPRKNCKENFSCFSGSSPDECSRSFTVLSETGFFGRFPPSWFLPRSRLELLSGSVFAVPSPVCGFWGGGTFSFSIVGFPKQKMMLYWKRSRKKDKAKTKETKMSDYFNSIDYQINLMLDHEQDLQDEYDRRLRDVREGVGDYVLLPEGDPWNLNDYEQDPSQPTSSTLAAMDSTSPKARRREPCTTSALTSDCGRRATTTRTSSRWSRTAGRSPNQWTTPNPSSAEEYFFRNLPCCKNTALYWNQPQTRKVSS